MYYIGTHMSDALADRFARELIAEGSLTPLMETPAGVEVAHREKDGVRYLFVLNHTGQAQTLEVPSTWKPIGAAESNTLPPYGVAVWMEDR